MPRSRRRAGLERSARCFSEADGAAAATGASISLCSMIYGRARTVSLAVAACRHCCWATAQGRTGRTSPHRQARREAQKFVPAMRSECHVRSKVSTPLTGPECTDSDSGPYGIGCTKVFGRSHRAGMSMFPIRPESAPDPILEDCLRRATGTSGSAWVCLERPSSLAACCWQSDCTSGQFRGMLVRDRLTGTRSVS